MKRIIEIPDNVVKAIQNGEDYRYDIHTAIAQSMPYDDSGDLISRDELKKAMWSLVINENDDIPVLNAIETIDNAPPVDAIVNTIEVRPQGERIRGFIDALDKAFLMFDANCTYSGERVLQILEKLKWLEKLKEEKGGTE